MAFLKSSSNDSEELAGVLAHDQLGNSEENIQELHHSQQYNYDLAISTESSQVRELPNAKTTSTHRTLNTFSGVFCPVALSQFSTLLFLRMGLVVGQSGLLECSVQLMLAYLILLLTILSICAISTNGAIEGGGMYFMISRTLGPEFGGSIGLLFFFANVFACGLYVVGFTEGLVDNFGPTGTLLQFLPGVTVWWKYLYSVIILMFCLAICLVGGSMFARTSFFILLILLICFFVTVASLLFQQPMLVPIPHTNHIVYKPGLNSSQDPNYTVYYNFTGPRMSTFTANLHDHYQPDYTSTSSDYLSFPTVFAILFSSVTGIMNGANMSGELKKPSKSIPQGTLAATFFTFTVYLSFSYIIGSSCEYELLVNNYGFLISINFWRPFVIIGIFAATLSAALGNLIGASRILTALAKDKLFGLFLKPAAVTTANGNPIPAVIITFFLVLIVLLIGNLNTIAGIVSTFYLLSYASTNLACAALDLAAAPNFRPTFKLFHWSTCLIGLAGCLFMSFLVSYVYTPISIMLLLGLIIALHLRDLPDTWGSITQALIFHQVRKYLLKLDVRKSHVKYWRPQILLLVANPRSNSNLIEFVNDLKKGGLYVLGHVLKDNFDDLAEDPAEKQYHEWLTVVDYLKVKAFVELTVAPSVREGMHHLIRVSGLGGMKPNTVCLGFYDDADPVNTLALKSTNVRLGKEAGAYPTRNISAIQLPHVRQSSESKNVTSEVEYVCMLRDVLKMGKNLLVCRNFQHADTPHGSLVQRFFKGHKRYIDVWPINFFQPHLTGFIDTSCLLELQFATILHMVKAWKWFTQLRVFLCVDSKHSKLPELTSRLNSLLLDLRIQAQTHILDWEHVLQEHSINHTEVSSSGLSEQYLRAVNQSIRVQSPGTAATFLYLPRPPEEEEAQIQYLQDVDTLTRDLPPTVLVHGLQEVTATNL